MSRRRWIADEVSAENRAVLTGEHAQHLARVLRARVGQEFEVVADGIVRRGQVVAVSSERVELELFEAVPAADALPLTLALAIFKFDRMEWAIEKATELGVSRIVPVVARRTDARLAAAAGKRVERWTRIAREAAEQSRRLAPPEVWSPVKLPELLAMYAANAVTDSLSGSLLDSSPQTSTEAAPVAALQYILLDETEDSATLAAVLRASEGEARSSAGVVLAIGPEGGWSSGEHDAFQRAGWQSVTLGPSILRTETAAIAALAITAAILQVR